jgi:hypothetical protein
MVVRLSHTTNIIMKIQSILMASVCLVAATYADDEKWDLKKLDLGKLPPAAARKDLSFAKDIKPLMDNSCTRCHGEEKQKGGLRLDSREAALKGGDDGKMIVPGKSKESLLVAAIAQVHDDIAMPPKMKPRGGGPGGPSGANRPEGSPRSGPPQGGSRPPNGPGGPGGPGAGGPPKPLTAEQVGLVRAWIDQGAK